MAADNNMVSFVLRFVCEEPSGEEAQADGRPAPGVNWHGVIRHVQSNTERRFARWEDAVAFIAQYVDVGQG